MDEANNQTFENTNPEEVVSKESPAQDAATKRPAPAKKQESILGAAWKDIVGSKGWFSKIFQLMIMGLIPFMNFFVSGYMLDWSATLLGGVREALPKRAFTRKSFVVGFFYQVLVAICWCVSLVTLVFLPIPLLGAVVIFVLNVFITAYGMIAGIRMALEGHFLAAFDLSDIWKVMKKDLGSLFVAVFIPALIMSIVATVLALILVAVVAGSVLASVSTAHTISNLSSFSNMTYNPYATYIMSNPWLLLGQVVAVALPLLVVFLIVFGMLVVFMNIWQMRAVAHWLKKNTAKR